MRFGARKYLTYFYIPCIYAAKKVSLKDPQSGNKSSQRETRAFTSINDLRKAAFLKKEPEGELLSLAAPSRPAIPSS